MPMPPFFPSRLPLAAFRQPTSKQRLMANWRGVELSPEEEAQKDRVKSVADIMPKVAKQIRLDTRQSETEIVKVWNNLMDPNITAHAQPTGLRNGTLFVTVDSSVWLDEIVRYRRREILQRLQHSFGMDLVKKISFRVG